MNIFLAGGGRVGFHLAQLLCIEKHNVTVLEQDKNQLEHLDNTLDVQTVPGDAVSAMLLRQHGAGDAGLFVATTGNDEVNLISASTAKGLGAKQVVARVHMPVYVESSVLYETLLGIDYVLSPEALTALEVARYIDNPGIVETQDFGGGMVQMTQMRVAKSSTTGGKTLKDVCPPGMGVLLAAISRNGATFIPHGDSVVEPGDLVTLIGHRDKLPALREKFKGTEFRPERIVIMGGGSIGLHLAQALEKRPVSVTLMDWDLRRCHQLAARLENANIVYRDATKRVSLEMEHVDQADLFVATASDDERNIMASVLAKEVGVRRTIAVVHEPDFAPLVSRLGIDHAVTPRASTANRILRLVHQDRASTVAVLEEGNVEILEFKVSEGAPIAGKTLRENRGRFPRDVLVASIMRGDEVIVPSGGDTVMAGDSIVIVATLDSLEAVHKLVRQ